MELLTKRDGRIRFTVLTQRPNPKFVPNERDLYALEFIHRHTLVASNTLYELMRTRTGTKDKTNFYDWLRRLYDGGCLQRPASQRYTDYKDGNFHVYSLTKKGETFLKQAGKLEEVVRHSGFFPHQLMGATYTATIDILCRREGYRFIPAHEYLGDIPKKVLLPFYWKNKLIDDKRFTPFDPDYIFAIEYGKSRIGFLPEFNRATETFEPESYKRRSDLKTIRQMDLLIGEEAYKELYDRDEPLKFLFVTISPERAKGFIDLATRELGKVNYINATAMPTFASPFKPPHFGEYLFTDPMIGTGKEFTVKKTASK